MPIQESPAKTAKRVPESVATGTAAKLLGVSNDTIQRWIEEGRLIAWRYTPRGNYFVGKKSLMEIIRLRQASDE